MTTRLARICGGAACLLLAAHTGRAQQLDLTGIWQDNAGGQYQLRQVNEHLFWVDDRRPRYINIFHGTIRGNMIHGTWADLPGGELMHSGELELRAESNDRIVNLASAGDRYGGTVLARVGSAPPAQTAGPGLAGVWNWSFRSATESRNTVITINPDGTFSGSGSSGRWELVDPAQRVYRLNWRGGGLDTVTLSPDGQGLAGRNRAGGELNATRSGPAPGQANQ